MAKQHFEVLRGKHQKFPVLKSREVDALQAKLFAAALATPECDSIDSQPSNESQRTGNATTRVES
jgi:hypothetical protein